MFSQRISGRSVAALTRCGPAASAINLGRPLRRSARPAVSRVVVATGATARGGPVAQPHPADDEQQERGDADQAPDSGWCAPGPVGGHCVGRAVRVKHTPEAWPEISCRATWARAASAANWCNSSPGTGHCDDRRLAGDQHQKFGGAGPAPAGGRCAASR